MGMFQNTFCGGMFQETCRGGKFQDTSRRGSLQVLYSVGTFQEICSWEKLHITGVYAGLMAWLAILWIRGYDGAVQQTKRDTGDVMYNHAGVKISFPPNNC